MAEIFKFPTGEKLEKTEEKKEMSLDKLIRSFQDQIDEAKTNMELLKDLADSEVTEKRLKPITHWAVS